MPYVIKPGDQVETLTDKFPAAFAGIVLAVGEENGRILVRAENGIERVYTPESLRIVENR